MWVKTSKRCNGKKRVVYNISLYLIYLIYNKKGGMIYSNNIPEQRSGDAENGGAAERRSRGREERLVLEI